MVLFSHAPDTAQYRWTFVTSPANIVRRTYDASLTSVDPHNNMFDCSSSPNQYRYAVPRLFCLCNSSDFLFVARLLARVSLQLHGALRSRISRALWASQFLSCCCIIVARFVALQELVLHVALLCRCNLQHPLLS